MPLRFRRMGHISGRVSNPDPDRRCKEVFGWLFNDQRNLTGYPKYKQCQGPDGLPIDIYKTFEKLLVPLAN